MKIPTLTLVKSVAWNSLGNTLGISCTLISLMIMSRLLTPADFGLFGIAFVVLMVTEGFCYGDPQDALVQHKDTTKDHTDTLNTVSTLNAFAFLAGIYLAAPFLADLFKQPELTNMIRVVGLMLLLGPLSATSAALLIRRLEFKKITIVDIVGTVVPAIIGVTLAFYWRSAWALVYLELSRRIIRCVLFTWFAHYLPRYRIDLPSLKELFNYAGSSTLLGVAASIQRATPGAIIGWAMGAAPLGLFNMALRFFEQARQALITPFGAVTFSVFSKAQASTEELHKHIRDSAKISMFLIFPAFAGALVLAPLLVPLLFGDQWTGAVRATQLALILGPLTMIEEINNNLLKGIGRPALIARITIISTVFTAIGVMLVSGFTIEAVMGILIAQKLLAVVLAATMAKRFAGYDFIKQLQPLYLPGIATAVMAALVWAGFHLIDPDLTRTVKVLLLVPLGIVSYFVTVRVIAPELVATVMKTLLRRGAPATSAEPAPSES